MPRATDTPQALLSALPTRLRLGVSSCLLGENVRWDGTARGDPYILGTLARHFELVPVCPEMAIGMGVPREPIRLVGPAGARRVVGVNDPSVDVTDALARYGARMAEELGDICGYILKARSPSCGVERVPVHRPGSSQPLLQGRGMYAQTFMSARPELPVEEEGWLGDPELRENFFTRVFALARWQAMAARGITPAALRAFHEAHRLMLMAHGRDRLQALSPHASRATAKPMGAATRTYLLAFMDALRTRATRSQHAAVLTHLAGLLREHLSPGDKAELRGAIRSFRGGELPRIVPITLLRHHFRNHPNPAALNQVYLEPHPSEQVLLSGG